MTQQSTQDSREPIGFWSLDLKANVVTFDAATSAYFQIDAEKAKAGISREHLWSHIHPDDLEGLRGRVQESIAKLGSFAYSYRIQAKPESVTYVRVLGSCFASESGEASHMAGIIIDVGAIADQSAHVQVIEHLMNASAISKTTGDFVLPRLIDAVLLEAGRSLARGMAAG
jgi:hypothetical protein